MVSAFLNSMGIRGLSSSELPDVSAPPVSTTERGSGTGRLWFHPFGSEVGLDLEASVAGLQIFVSTLQRYLYLAISCTSAASFLSPNNYILFTGPKLLSFFT
jgi:hypothetical protein